MPKNDQIWPEIGIFVHFGSGLAGSFGALFVGWLVVVARRLYLARHLFALCTFWFFFSDEVLVAEGIIMTSVSES